MADPRAAFSGKPRTSSVPSGSPTPGARPCSVVNRPAGRTSGRGNSPRGHITHSNIVTDSVNSVTASDPISISGGTLNVAGAFSDSSLVTLSSGTLSVAGNLN